MTAASSRTTRSSTSPHGSATVYSSGPAAVLTNDAYPRAINPDLTSKSAADWDAVGVTVGDGASIGARSVCVAPVTIGAWAMVAAGSVVTRDVPDHALVAGVPARQARLGGAHRAPTGAGRGRLVPMPRHGCHLRPGARRRSRGKAIAVVSDFIPAARPLIGMEERAAVDRVLRSGMLAQGPEVAAFETEFSAHFGRRTPLRRCELWHQRPTSRPARGRGRPGDEVVVPSFTFAATANAVRAGRGRHRSSPTSTPSPSASTRYRRTRQWSSRDRRRSCRCTCTAIRPTWRSAATSRPDTGCGSSRTPPRRTGPRSAAGRWGRSATSPCSPSTPPRT